MNKFVEQFVISVVLIFLFLFDFSTTEIEYKKFFLLSHVFFMLLINTKRKSSFVVPAVILGLLIDWYQKGLVGVSSLMILVALYAFNLLRIRFYGDKLLTALVNFVFGFFLAYVFNGFILSNVFTLIIVAAISVVITSYFWLRD